MEDIIKAINEEIAKRTQYGIREEDLPKGKFSILSWSNGSGKWFYNRMYTYHYTNNVHFTTAKLDASDILVPYSYEDIRDIIDKLDVLPLYAKSFEIKSI